MLRLLMQTCCYQGFSLVLLEQRGILLESVKTVPKISMNLTPGLCWREQQELGEDRVGPGQLHPKHLVGEFLPQPLKGTCEQQCLMENSHRLCPRSAMRGLELH